MKLGTVIWSKLSGLGLFMYPHKEFVDVNPNILCSVINRNGLIFHVPLGDIEPYTNHCWNCLNPHMDSFESETCPVCHWIICPVCGACKPSCDSDGIIILDESDPNGWEEITGYNNIDFFDEEVNDKFHYLGQAELIDAEECYLALINEQLIPIFVYQSGIASLYIEKIYSEIAKEIIYDLDLNLTYNLKIDVLNSDLFNSRGRCIFCGSTTYDDIVCPECADNID